MRPIRDAWELALYGPRGFYTRQGPGAHFRTSPTASPLFARAIAGLAAACHLDTVYDMAAGGGELAAGLAALEPDLTVVGVDLRPRPDGLPDAVDWLPALPDRVTGLVVANEWLDNVPCTVAEVDGEGRLREVLVESGGAGGGSHTLTTVPWYRRTSHGVQPGESAAGPGRVAGRGGGEAVGPSRETVGTARETVGPARESLGTARESLGTPRESLGTPRESLGTPRESLGTAGEALGDAVAGPELEWARRWWPPSEPGTRVEIGRARDASWRDVVGRLERGVAVAIDYGHVEGARPPYGSLRSYRNGLAVDVAYDGSRDITADVALDAVAHAVDARLLRQGDALRSLGVSGARPDLELARTDPVGYVRALSQAGAAAELTASEGLGGFGWVVTAIGVSTPWTTVP